MRSLFCITCIFFSVYASAQIRSTYSFIGGFNSANRITLNKDYTFIDTAYFAYCTDTIYERTILYGTYKISKTENGTEIFFSYTKKTEQSLTFSDSILFSKEEAFKGSKTSIRSLLMGQYAGKDILVRSDSGFMDLSQCISNFNASGKLTRLWIKGNKEEGELFESDTIHTPVFKSHWDSYFLRIPIKTMVIKYLGNNRYEIDKGYQAGVRKGMKAGRKIKILGSEKYWWKCLSVLDSRSLCRWI